LLPSFSEALRVAGKGDGVGYVHDWTKNGLGEKIEWELELMRDGR